MKADRTNVKRILVDTRLVCFVSVVRFNRLGATHGTRQMEEPTNESTS